MKPPPLVPAAEETLPRRPSPAGLCWIAALWLVVAVIFAVQLYALGLVTWNAALVLSLLDWAPWIVFGPVVAWLAHRVPVTPQTWRRAVPAHVIFCVVVVLAMGAATAFVVPDRGRLFSRPEGSFTPGPPRERGPESGPSPGREMHPDFGDKPFRSRPPEGFWARMLSGTRVSVPVYWMLVAGAHAVAQYRRGVERERRALQAEAHLAEARLQALQGQLNPHFLFNTLNTIAELVYEDPRGAETMIVSLSDLLRAALAAQSRREVSLSEEMAFVRRYCGIQRVRFSDRLDVRYEVDEAALGAAVPTLLLQPLVENAILHGMGDRATPITVWVRARATAERLLLEVADSGAGLASGTAPDDELRFTEGVGLGNTRARLAALHGAAHVFHLARAAEGGLSVRIELPLRILSA